MKDIRFRRIVVPTDFSELATGALELAGGIAHRSGGDVDLLYADPFLPPPHFTSSQVEALAEDLRQSKHLATEELERYRTEHLSAEIAGRSLVIESRPVGAIVNYSTDRDADLIVMGTHGRSGIKRMMLGSVTERVLREATVPLLTTRREPGEVRPIRSILCPVNFTGAAENALRHATELARLMDAGLSVVHVRESEDHERDEDQEIDRCVIDAGGTPDEVDRVLLTGNADEAVLRYVAEHDVDLVVLAATHKRFFATTVLGSTTVHVIRLSPVPV
ncbi:MAG: universal stress protein, partial [Thermoanaerobaculia bacterium]|nr:universal stress protein [Thermoanaerobaculia bacterium]